MSHPTTRMPSRSSRIVLGTLAAVALTAAMVGVPLALAALGGNPLPHHLESLSSVRDTVLHKDVAGALFIRLIVIIGWLAWASFALSVVVDVVARLSGGSAARLPGLGGPQRWAAGLITAVALTISAPAAGLASPHAPVAAVAMTTLHDAPVAGQAVAGQAAAGQAVAGQAVAGQAAAGPVANRAVVPPAADRQVPTAAGTHAGSETAAHDSHLVYQVRKGDYLGRIAERFGGTFEGAREIAHENHIADPNLINIGERITLPTGADDSGAHRHAGGHVVAGSGDRSAGDSEALSTHATPPHTGVSANAPDAAHPIPHEAVPPASWDHAPDAAHPIPREAVPPASWDHAPDAAHPIPPAPPAAAPAATARSAAPASAVSAGLSRAASHAPVGNGHAAPVVAPASRAAATAGDASPPVATAEPAVGVVGEMLAASGTLAAVVSLAVVVMRGRDQANQRMGRTSVMPATGGGVPRLMAPTRVADIVRLDTALRVLSDRVADWPVAAIPQVAGVWLDHASATLLLADEACPAPPPFVDDPNGWRLDAATPVGQPTDQIAPLPLLCAVGGRDRQHALLDLEYLRVLGIGGDPVEAMNVMRFIVAELCHNVWADDVRLTLAGFGRQAATLSAFDPARIRVEPSIPAAVAAFHARLVDAVANLDDVRPPDVLLVAAPATGDHAGLAALERDLMATPGVGMAVVVAPTAEGLPVGKYQMNVGGGGDLHIGFLGDALMPAAALPASLVGEVVSLIGQARESGDPSPLDLARAASRTAFERAPGGRTTQFAGPRRHDPAQRSFRTELAELTRGRDIRHAGIG